MTVRARLAGLAMVVLGAALAGCASAPTAGAGVAAATPTREVLPNGVVLISQDHRAAGLVALQLWLRVGGRDETPMENRR